MVLLFITHALESVSKYWENELWIGAPDQLAADYVMKTK